MKPTIFGGILLVIGIWCQFGAYRRTLIVMFALVVFGAASAVDLPALGGASITPANFFLIFLLLRLVSMRGGTGALVAEVEPRRPLFAFLLLIVWIIGSAMLLPRLFDGATNVFSLSRSLDNDGDTTPLHPTSGNLSQAVYAVGGFLVACAVSAFARKPGGYGAVLTAIILVTSLDIGFAVLDIVTSATHTSFLLDPIHTASYAFLTDDELGGLKRISGSFTEASGFASFSLTVMAINFTLFVLRVRPRFTGTASLVLTALIVLSTSSAGYAGLGVFYGAFLVCALVAGIVFRRKRALALAFGTAGAGTLIVGLVFLFVPPIVKVATSVVNDSLLNKAQTDSGVERGSWNTQAWQVFTDTHWLGAGIGATRGSNYFLVLLSNLGAIGFVLFLALLARVTLARLSPALIPQERAIVWAARVGVLTALIPAALVGTVYDLGTLFYALIGVAASGAALVTDPGRVAARQPVSRHRVGTLAAIAQPDGSHGRR